MLDAFDSVAGGVAFRGIERDVLLGLRLDADAVEQRAKLGAAPTGVADEAAADRIGDALEGQNGLEGRELADFGRG